jgi:chromosome segregation ATPase
VLSRYFLDLIAALGGGGAVAYLLTLRQRKSILNAQATNTQAQAFERIISAAGNGLEHQTALVPALLERITKLEAREEIRDRRDVEREKELEDLRDELEATKTALATAQAHASAVDQWIDAVFTAMREHRAWDEDAVAQIEDLGGTIAPPPAIPDRRANTHAAAHQ